MKLFLVEYDNGGEYEQQEIETIGIFESLGKARDFTTSCGFEPSKNDASYFVRQQHNIPSECAAHKDYAFITPFELNKPKEDIEYFTHHYKLNKGDGIMYKDHIGHQYRFKKGDKVPQWIFECEVAFFGTNVLVIPEYDKLHIKGYVPHLYKIGEIESDECLIQINNKNGETCLQVCPQIYYRTDYKDIFIM